MLNEYRNEKTTKMTEKSEIDVPTVEGILKMLNNNAHMINKQELLSDVFECIAINISNAFDIFNVIKREKKQVSIMNKYSESMRKLIDGVANQIKLLLINQIENTVEFDDYLGKLYMLSDTNNKDAGQFFTPYCVSKLIAEMTIDKSKVKNYSKEDKILTINDPACGSGGMITAVVDILYNVYHFNTARNLFVVCSDIDKRCVHMTYIQLSLIGVPAIVMHQNTLTKEVYDSWTTPAYAVQYTRFRNQLKNL